MIKTDLASDVVVVSDSDSDADEVSEVIETDSLISKAKTVVPSKLSLKRVCEPSPQVPQKEIKRLKPTLISSVVSTPKKLNMDFDDDDFEISLENGNNNNHANSTMDDEQQQSSSTTTKKVTENPITESFAGLLAACRQADSSKDMAYVINRKLLKYYHRVHPEFISSKSFQKSVTAVTAEIQNSPKFVYLKLSTILDELQARKNSGQTVVTNEGVSSTGDSKKDYHIKRLNKALYSLKKQIAKLDATEVDLDDESNSVYLLTERYKERAYKIYEKICDLTGESKHAHRQVKRPITFKGTGYTQFNNTIQSYVNRTGLFPHFSDVLRTLEHCNKQYDYKLGAEQMKSISQDAFIRIGKCLQKRRKADLYETVTFLSEGNEKDPANEDASLRTKLEENKKHHSKINAIIDKFAEMQDESAESKKASITEGTTTAPNTNNKENEMENSCSNAIAMEDIESETEDSEEDEEEEEDEEAEIQNVEIVISESEEEDDELII